MKRFFTPFVGDNYQQGIRNKKVLVLGASFYCNKQDCPFFSDCTNTEKKDSSAYNEKCPYYQKDKLLLADEPSHCVSDGTTSHNRFAKYVGTLLNETDYYKIWSHMAFTNYVQFLLPAERDSYRETRWADLSERDMEAFNETLFELQPHIVVVWGNVFNSRVKEKNEHLVSLYELKQTEYYICHLDMPGVEHQVAVINPYHPSSSAWYGNLEKFDTYFKSIL